MTDPDEARAAIEGIETAEDDPDLDADVADAVEGLDVPDGAGAAVERTVEQLAEDPAEQAADEQAPATGTAGGENRTGTEDDADTVSMLEFVLGDERYCLDISYVEQIVEREGTTRIPNAPAFVDGVIDLRGDITTVIDPTVTVDTGDDGAGGGDLIVVFDSTEMADDWSVGWAVDGVRRVSTVSLAEVKESPVDEPWINGIVKRETDGEFVIWTEPGELMHSEGAGERTDV